MSGDLARPDAPLSLRVHAMTYEAEAVLGVELRPERAGELLPGFGAGAHIDLHLPGGLRRSYSLTDEPGERRRYRIAVHRAVDSRGGSRWMHESLRPGAVLAASGPRNNFPLTESAARSVFIAGGIGITPILAMIRRLVALGRPWDLHYATRTRAHAAFVEPLHELARQGGGRLDLRHDREPGGRPLDLAAIVRELPQDAHVYCCGPAGMLKAFELATAHLAPERVHVEHFAGKEPAAAGGGFRVKLHRSGRTLEVAPGQTILDCLVAAGVEPMWSCREGVCGTCETRVLDGVPDHRDLVLTPDEQARNDRMMVCCSGARSATLVLDL
ncbi:MAG: oxidoreductase [Burkholderiales bacterium]|nr:oxidoreductase [Burkholderiales bacterium]